MELLNIYLPIAGIAINYLLLILMGIGVGLISGVFGVGGGFVMTPILFFFGIPPSVAVATGANQVLATSIAGALIQNQEGNIDYRMGNYMLAGGVVSVMLGTAFFVYLKSLGQVDLFIRLFYIIFLSSIGFILARITWLKLANDRYTIPILNWQLKAKKPISEKKRFYYPLMQWLSHLPFEEYFPRSKVRYSIFLPILLGAVIGILSSIMGIGGGIIAIPAMIYLLRMPQKLVIGTSLYQIVFIAMLTSLMHSVLGRSLDIALAFFLSLGGVIGARFGSGLGKRLHPNLMQFLFAFMLLLLASSMVYRLFILPESLFTLKITIL